MFNLTYQPETGQIDNEQFVDATLADLFRMAIQLEESAQVFYTQLSSLFAGCPDAADYWRQYADEEAEHAGWLDRLRKECSPERLADPADPFYLLVARELLSHSLEEALDRVSHLGDAYQLALQIENSETNAIFNFLVENTARDKMASEILRELVGGHVRRLEHEFPEKFGNHVEQSTIEICRNT